MDDVALYRRQDLLSSGFTAAELRQLRSSGQLSLVRRGRYLAGAQPDDEADRHRLLIGATFPELAADAVLSHGSAAVLHGLPTWGVPLDRVAVTRNRRSGARRGTRAHVHAAPLGTDEVCLIDGFPVTSLPRTVVDIARALVFESAVVIGDAALRLIGPDELADMLARARRRPGVARAGRAVAFMNPASESVGESRSRVAIAMAGLPAPVLQWEVRAPSGRLIGRTDLAWPQHRVVGEFDGRVKYGRRLLKPGQTGGDVVFEEKRREDELRAEGLAVVRWTWQDLSSFAPIAHRLRQALS
ncbi:type IV toxin-antitoxin system AbiEi family antitoxin domain-containing protein [Pseudonocardia spinosispora]|uniref:type IV toxin-antitoxin system AbiEi family antitoxin domain-containing protein n=1 Tax=Pseudonocardia spinosispora TaxID=103441 RepID=UPI0003F70C8A|nr:hypothetical protein [Pseudonocardia spinosispora]